MKKLAIMVLVFNDSIEIVKCYRLAPLCMTASIGWVSREQGKSGRERERERGKTGVVLCTKPASPVFLNVATRSVLKTARHGEIPRLFPI